MKAECTHIVMQKSPIFTNSLYSIAITDLSDKIYFLNVWYKNNKIIENTSIQLQRVI